MRTTDDLVDQRQQWVMAICAGIVGQLEGCPAVDPVTIAPGLGDVQLVRALIVMRIAVLLASGRSNAEVVELLADSPIFATPRPEQQHLIELVTRVVRLLERHGLTGSIGLMGLGLRAWSPERAPTCSSYRSGRRNARPRFPAQRSDMN